MLGEKLLGTFLGILDCRLRRVGPFISIWHLIYLLVASAAFKIITFYDDNPVEAARIRYEINPKLFFCHFKLQTQLQSEQLFTSVFIQL